MPEMPDALTSAAQSVAHATLSVAAACLSSADDHAAAANAPPPLLFVSARGTPSSLSSPQPEGDGGAPGGASEKQKRASWRSTAASSFRHRTTLSFGALSPETSASHSRGPVVVPGSVSGAARVRVCETRPRGAASAEDRAFSGAGHRRRQSYLRLPPPIRPAITTPHDSAPSADGTRAS